MFSAGLWSPYSVGSLHLFALAAPSRSVWHLGVTVSHGLTWRVDVCVMCYLPWAPTGLCLHQTQPSAGQLEAGSTWERTDWRQIHRCMQAVCVPVGALGKGQITSHRKHLRLPDRVITAQSWPSSGTSQDSCGCRKWVPLNSTISSLAELGGRRTAGDCTKAREGTNLGALSSRSGNLGSRLKHSGSEE